MPATYDRDHGVLRWDGGEWALPFRSMRAFSALHSAYPDALTRDELAAAVYGQATEAAVNRISGLAHLLRTSLERHPETSWRLHSAYGSGLYRLIALDEPVG